MSRRRTCRAAAPLLLAAAVPLLAACVNDAASWQIDGKEHALTLFRSQRWLWSSKVELEIVAARLPDCQRRHVLAPANSAQATIDVFRVGDTEFLLRQGSRHYRVETATCTGFEALDAAPAGGLGTAAGSFRESGGKLRFVPQGAG